MALAVHRLAGAAAALAIGSAIIGGSMFLVSKSMFVITKTIDQLPQSQAAPPAAARPAPSPGVFYVQTYPLKVDGSGRPTICGTADGHSPGGTSVGATIPCYYRSETPHK